MRIKLQLNLKYQKALLENGIENVFYDPKIKKYIVVFYLLGERICEKVDIINFLKK